MSATITSDAVSLNHKVMDRMAKSWSDRVAVRQERIDLTQYYDASIPDFPIEIIPFGQDEEFTRLCLAAGPQAMLRYLAATWVGYNERVIFVEDDIVQPLCGLLRKNVLPGVNDPNVQQVLAQVQVDEQFHTLMCLEVCNSARARHQIADYVLPEPLLGRRIREQLAITADPMDRALVRMAYGTVSETTIHDYLKKLSSVTTIQPLNRAHTEMHRRDETAHGTVFLEIAGSVYRALDEPLKKRFTGFFTKALFDSVEIDMGFWASTLPYLVQRDWGPFVQRIQQGLNSKRIGRDYAALVAVLEDLGIKDKIEFAFE